MDWYCIITKHMRVLYQGEGQSTKHTFQARRGTNEGETVAIVVQARITDPPWYTLSTHPPTPS